MKLHTNDRVLKDAELNSVIGGAFWQGIGRWIDQHI